MIAVLGLSMAIALMVLAGSVMLHSWRRYGPALQAAEAALAATPERLEMRYRIIEYGRSNGGNVVALPVRPRLTPLQPGLRQPQRAAA
jgi:hypothetical protein